MRRFLAVISWLGFVNGLVGLARNLDDPRLNAPLISIILGLGLTNAAIIGNGILHWKAANRLKAGLPLSRALRIWSWLFCIGSFGLAVLGWWGLLSHWSLAMTLDPTRAYLGIAFYTFVTLNAFTFLETLQHPFLEQGHPTLTTTDQSSEAEAPTPSAIQALRQLGELRDKGLLTEQEYEVAAARAAKAPKV